jgi:hypothetical protein
MGHWKTERGQGSDEMAEILGQAMAKVSALPEEPTLYDMADAIEFASRGMLVVELHDDVPLALLADDRRVKLADLLDKSSIFLTIPNRGQVHRPSEEV